jgi:hypothetical protein
MGPKVHGLSEGMLLAAALCAGWGCGFPLITLTLCGRLPFDYAAAGKLSTHYDKPPAELIALYCCTALSFLLVVGEMYRQLQRANTVFLEELERRDCPRRNDSQKTDREQSPPSHKRPQRQYKRGESKGNMSPTRKNPTEQRKAAEEGGNRRQAAEEEDQLTSLVSSLSEYPEWRDQQEEKQARRREYMRVLRSKIHRRGHHAIAAVSAQAKAAHAQTVCDVDDADDSICSSWSSHGSRSSRSSHSCYSLSPRSRSSSPPCGNTDPLHMT